jgi:hypothetical protein
MGKLSVIGQNDLWPAGTHKHDLSFGIKMPENQWDFDRSTEGEPISGFDDDDRHWEEDLRTGRVHYMTGVRVRPPRSGLGLISLALSVLAAIMIVGSMIAGTIAIGQNPHLQQDSPQLLGFACVLLLGMGLSILSGILGLIGLFQPDREKTCAVIGVILAGMEIVGVSGLTLIGLILS